MRNEWHWFVRCDLQIFSGCVCHLEQLHAQSPFLFPIVFSINIFCLWTILIIDVLKFGLNFGRIGWIIIWNVNALLLGSFLIKFSSRSAPTKIDELTAGSDEKHSAAPPGIEPRVLRILVTRSNRGFFFVWSGCQFFYLCRSWTRRDFELFGSCDWSGLHWGEAAIQEHHHEHAQLSYVLNTASEQTSNSTALLKSLTKKFESLIIQVYLVCWSRCVFGFGHIRPIYKDSDSEDRDSFYPWKLS